MALTTEQEAKIAQIIAAFDNGKTLGQLPLAAGANPFGLECEVLDTADGTSKRAALAAMLPYMEQQSMYGVEIDTAISSAALTRIGNAALHKSLPVQGRMRGCLMADDGAVNEYLNPSDWTGHTRDGSRGQVMVEIPAHWRRFETEGTKRRVKISEYPIPGYHLVPLQYVSAYEASMERTTGKLCSVVNMSVDFRGGNNNAEWDGTYRTFLGRPATSISRGAFRSAARKRKAGSTEWNCYLYGAHETLFWLFAVEYATLNTQAAYNAELTTDGYRQGGLGDGVTTIDSSKWSAFNGYNPFIPCGYTDGIGNGTGYKEFTMPEEYDATTPKVVQVPRYRGIENPFGHIWKWSDGINVRVSPDEENGGDGLSKVFVCDDPAKFSDSGYAGYVYVGDEARTEGYVKEIIFGETGNIMASVVGGGSTTYYCDRHYTSIPTTEALRGVLFGGTAASGSAAGFVFADANSAPSASGANVGSRLCFIPG